MDPNPDYVEESFHVNSVNRLIGIVGQAWK